MTGNTLGHYHIDEKIGEGGMGVVYRARDEYLNRDVALKVLSEHLLADAAGRGRLLQEARAVSPLNHPNICTIHEVGEENGEFYIVMEFIEGQPLSSLIGTTGLPAESVLRYGTQIADALAHAHDRGIVHRDLKSSNIMITPDGRAKVLDFGLARRIATQADDEATRSLKSVEAAGGLSGTIPYMAPEILRGEPGDYRSDLWALGVVLYETASAQLPFRGRTAFEVSSAILHELPAPLPSRIPPGIWTVAQRCLTKDPALRYQRASEVRAALETAQSATSTVPEPPDDQRGPRTTVMYGIRHVSVKNGDVLLLLGTTKGAFLLRSNADRSRWAVGGPYFHGQSVYSMVYDGRDDRHRLWASTSSYWGTQLRSSEDFGKTWTNPVEAIVKFPADCGVSLKNIWQICLGRASEHQTLYCGVEPPRFSNRMTRESPGRWSAASSIIPTARAGCPGMAG